MFLHLNLQHILESIGYIGLFVFVFAETGLFFGFFLPGDSLLFTAGLLAAAGYFSIVPIILVIAVAAILGDSAGYYFGRKTKDYLFKKEDSWLFSKKNLRKSHAFYDAHGSKTIVIARFIPIIRTFAPILAGSAEMNYRLFFMFNAIGGVLWTLLLTLLGYWLGNSVPHIDHYILPGIFVVIVLSFIPVLWEMFRLQQGKKM